MSEIRNRLRRLKFKVTHDFFDISNVVLIIAIVLCLTWTYQSIMAMSKNQELTERLAREKKELELLTLEVEAGELENEYFKSDEYQELVARKSLDKQQPGENMVVMPNNSEYAINKHQNVVSVVEEKELSNPQKWMKFLFPDY